MRRPLERFMPMPKRTEGEYTDEKLPFSLAGWLGAKVAESRQGIRASWLKEMVVGAILIAVVGMWLVWFWSFLRDSAIREEILGACTRVMKEDVQRCYDTVIIQRGGFRR